jgi:hypothetical protein
MSELEDGPFVGKLVPSEELDETVLDPLAYCSGRELGKFAPDVELATLTEVGTVRGLPPRIHLDSDELGGVRKLNYRHVDGGTGFYSPVALEPDPDGYTGRELVPGTVAIGRMRPSRNNTTVLDPELLGSGTVVTDSEWLLFEPDDGDLYFWSLVLRSTNVLRQFTTTRGQTRPRLHEAELRDVSVPVLDPEERERIDARRRERFRDLQRIEREITDTAAAMDAFLDGGGSLP